jgi:hypothetical protein
MVVQVDVPSAPGTKAGAAYFSSGPAKKNVRVLRHNTQGEISTASNLKPGNATTGAAIEPERNYDRVCWFQNDRNRRV